MGGGGGGGGGGGQTDRRTQTNRTVTELERRRNTEIRSQRHGEIEKKTETGEREVIIKYHVCT